jgi:uncharacterized protein
MNLKALLNELKIGLGDLFGSRVEKLLLFGSQARGDATPESDVDVLVILRGEADPEQLIPLTSELVSRLSLKYETVISRAFVSAEAFEKDRTPFLMNVRREAVAI